MPDFLCCMGDSAGLAAFVEVEIIGAAGGASRLPYRKLGSVRCFCGDGSVSGKTLAK